MDSITKKPQADLKSFRGRAWQALRSALKWFFETGWKGIAILIAIISLVYQTLPDPPRPRALLVCTTDGLPDLGVVCDTSHSAGFHRGFIDFGDGTDPRRIKTAITPPVPMRFLSQTLQTIKNKIGSNQPENEGDGSLKKERFVQETFHHQYKRVGQYEIRLRLEGDQISDSVVQVVTLQESDALAKTSLAIEGLELEFKDDSPTRCFEFRIMQMLRSNGIFFQTKHPSPQVLNTNGATTGWNFAENACAFNLSPDLEHDEGYSGRVINKIIKKGKQFINSENGRRVIIDNERVVFSYSLSTRGWLWGRPYVQFDGVVKCKGTKSIKGKVNMKTSRTRQYGIIEVEEEIEAQKEAVQTDKAKEDENDDEQRVVSLRDIRSSIRAWRFEHRQKKYCSTKDSPLDPIAIRCCGVEVSLAEWQPEDWPAKAWLEVAPLSGGEGRNHECGD